MTTYGLTPTETQYLQSALLEATTGSNGAQGDSGISIARSILSKLRTLYMTPPAAIVVADVFTFEDLQALNYLDMGTF